MKNVKNIYTQLLVHPCPRLALITEINKFTQIKLKKKNNLMISHQVVCTGGLDGIRVRDA
jgi:hypothetical protein